MTKIICGSWSQDQHMITLTQPSGASLPLIAGDTREDSLKRSAEELRRLADNCEALIYED